jgi:hypothetical protein
MTGSVHVCVCVCVHAGFDWYGWVRSLVIYTGSVRACVRMGWYGWVGVILYRHMVNDTNGGYGPLHTNPSTPINLYMPLTLRATRSSSSSFPFSSPLPPLWPASALPRACLFPLAPRAAATASARSRAASSALRLAASAATAAAAAAAAEVEEEESSFSCGLLLGMLKMGDRGL